VDYDTLASGFDITIPILQDSIKTCKVWGLWDKQGRAESLPEQALENLPAKLPFRPGSFGVVAYQGDSQALEPWEASEQEGGAHISLQHLDSAFDDLLLSRRLPSDSSKRFPPRKLTKKN
jgi:hypothetical protein